MNLLKSLTATAVKMLNESDLGQQAVALLQEAVQKAEGASVNLLSSPDLYRAKISDPTYERLPRVLQSLLAPEQWHEFLYVMKDSFFLVQGGHLHLQPEFKTGVNDFVQQLLHGKKALKPAQATVEANAVRLPPEGSAEECP